MTIGRPDPLLSLLERIRCSFNVRAAMVHLVDDEGIPLELSAGAPIPWWSNPAVRNLQALAANEAVVVPDVESEPGAVPDAGGHPIRFFAGMPLISEKGCPFGVLSLVHPQPRWLSSTHIHALSELAAQLAPLAARRRDEAVIARLRSRLEQQASTIRTQAEALAQGRSTFERAAADARLGIWECALHDDGLTWTDQVYELFEIPRGARLVRQKTLDCYTPASRAALEATRAAAIAGRRGFHLDAEIVTQKGRHRWIRLTAAVDCRLGSPVRLFGMKQDITEQKLLLDETRFRAERDAMTGLANRAQFEKRLMAIESRRRDDRPLGALLLVDLDGFKQVNDGFGHAVGDACLKETAHRLSEICAHAELVARIGGDEFAVLLGCALESDADEALAQEIVAVLARPMTCAGHRLQIGASVGIARVGQPSSASDLFTQADIALYAAKAAGRGTSRSYAPGMGSESERRIPWPIALVREDRSPLRPATPRSADVGLASTGI